MTDREPLSVLRDRANHEPLEVDISDYSDEWCAGFLAGQANALDVLLRQRFAEDDYDTYLRQAVDR